MTNRHHRPDQGAEGFVVKAAFSGLGIAGGLAYASGQLAGLAFGQDWLDVGAGDMVDILTRLPAHLDDPQLAWPAEAHDELPGPIGMYASAGAVSLTAGYATIRALYWWERLQGQANPRRWAARSRRRPQRGEGAEWATAWQLHRLLTRHPKRGRITLGLLGHLGMLLAAEPGASVCVFGPPGSKKTVGTVIPSLLDWDGPTVNTSVKPEVIKATITHRAQRGRVLIVDPTGLSGYPTAQWSPLTACATWAGAQATAKRIAETDPQMARDARGDHVFWVRSSERQLAPMLYAAGATPGCTMRDVVRWVATRDSSLEALELNDGRDEVQKLLEGLDHPEALAEWQAVQATVDKTLDSIYTTTADLLSVYADERIAAYTDGHDLNWQQFLSGANTLYLYAPVHEQKRLRPLFETLLGELLEAAYEHAARQDDGELPDPLLLALDEAANVAALANLPELVTTARGVGIHLLTVWHDWAQLRTRYGEAAATVLNGHRATLLLPGIKDPELLKMASDLLGDRAYTETTHSWDPDDHRARASESTISYRPLVPVDELRRLPDHTAVLLYGNQRPARLRLRPYYTRMERARRARLDRRLPAAQPTRNTGDQAATVPLEHPVNDPLPGAATMPLPEGGERP